jgi:hypothetical protein
MTAGSDTGNGAAISVTDSSGASARRSTIARRVGSASAAKARSSWALNSTMWLSIVAHPPHVKRSGFHDPVLCSGYGYAGAWSHADRQLSLLALLIAEHTSSKKNLHFRCSAS